MKRAAVILSVLSFFIFINSSTTFAADKAEVSQSDSTSVTVLLLDSNGNQLTGGSLQYYGEGAWQSVPSNSDGSFTVVTDQSSLSYEMTYEQASVIKSSVPVSEESVIFNTVNATVQLKSSTGTLIDEGHVEFHSEGWQNFGTTSGGVVTKELLPGEYAFKMSYVDITENKTQDIEANNVVTFQTERAEVQLRNSQGALIEGGNVQVYAGSWKTMDSAAVGVFEKELFAKEYAFKMTYEDITQNKKQDISTDGIITFQTVKAEVQLKNDSGALVDGGTAEVYAGSWKTMDSTGVGVFAKELLPKKYAFKMIYDGNINTYKQDIGADSIIEFQTESTAPVPVLTLSEPDDGIVVQEDSITVSGTVDNPASTTVTVNGQNVSVETDGSFGMNVALSEGTNTITVSEENQSGEVTEIQRTVTRDTSAPQITITTPSDSSFTNQPQISVTGSVSEPVSVLTLNADTVTVNPDGSFSATESISEGSNDIIIEAIDQVGNTATQSITVTGDFEQPEFNFSAISPDGPSDPNPEVIPVNDGDTVQVDQSEVYIIGSIINEQTEVTVSINQDTVIAQRVSYGGDTYDNFDKLVNLEDGINSFDIKVTDQAENVTNITLFVIAPTTFNPAISINYPIDHYVTDSSSVQVQGTVVDSSSNVSLSINEDPVTLTQSDTYTYDFSHKVYLFPGSNYLSAVATNADNNVITKSIKIEKNYNSTPPPAPEEVAPELDSTVVTTMHESTEFLFKGDSLIQRGVDDDIIEPERAGVVRGKVLDESGSPLSGVLITVLDHPEYGYTISRNDGMFDMAVNGGGDLTFRYEKENYLSVQRQVAIPWQDFATVDSVNLIQLDPNVTTIDFSDSTEVARGSMESDADGSRQATLMFEQGTSATMVMPDGSTQPLDSISVRATEYTVGVDGQESMPAKLPPSSAYTYAVELSVDEAEEVGATQIKFDKPVVNYVENFLGFPVGTIIPYGYYDREIGEWIASENGKVIQIKSVTDGLAEIDITGDGVAEPVDSLSALGIGQSERRKLAELYMPGESLWRVEVTHFTPHDYNFPPAGPPADAVPPKYKTNKDLDENDKSCKENGSIISIQNRTLGEFMDITGAPCGLYYNIANIRGFKSKYILPVTLTDSTIPSSLERIDLVIEVAGKNVRKSFDPQANLAYDFLWDGKDAYGRLVQGAVKAKVNIGYVYDFVGYRRPANLSRSFDRVGLEPLSAQPRIGNTFTLWQDWSTTIGQLVRKDFGGWHPGIHHQYDLTDRMLYAGNGTIRSAESEDNIVRQVFEESEFNRPVRDVAFGPDGSMYMSVSSLFSTRRIVRKYPDGTQETMLEFQPCAVPTILAVGTTAEEVVECGSLGAIDVASDGTVYFADFEYNRVFKINTNTEVELVAGTRNPGYSGDDGPAESAQLAYPTDVAVAADGAVYIADSGNRVIRKISTDGFITTVAGTGEEGFSGDGGLATEATFISVNGIDVDPEGSLFVADANRVRKISADGTINTVAGSGTPATPPYDDIPRDRGNGGPATSAILLSPVDVSVGQDGSLYIADLHAHQIRKVTPEGTIIRLAGLQNEKPFFEEGGFNFNDGPAPATRLSFPQAIATGPEDNIYFTEQDKSTVRMIEAKFDNFADNEIIVASQDGSQLYVFNSQGKHLRTQDALNGNTIFEFDYDSTGLLSKITDIDGLETIIERDAEGTPTAFVAPFGQRTELEIGTDGYLSSISNPEGEAYSFGYSSEGLLTEVTDPKGNLSSYAYDSLGYFQRVDYSNGGFKELSREETEDGFRVTMTTAEGMTQKYEVDETTNGNQTFINTNANGLETVREYGGDGSITVTSPDGTSTYTKQKPDPRFGMQVPLIDSMAVETPSGLTSIFSQSRTITQYTGDEVTGQTDSLITNGKVTVSEYDGNQNLTTTTSPEGRQTFSYTDSLGRVIQSSTPGLEPVNYSYDSNGFLTETEQGGRITEFTYNSDGYLESTTDPLGRTETTRYDSVGRVTNQILPNGEEIGYEYDENGNLTSITPPGQPAHSFAYTEVDLTDSYSPPTVPDSADGIHYTYNLDKHLVSTAFFDSSTIQMVYDTTNGYSPRPKKIIYDQGTTSFDYDSTTGNLASIVSSDSVVTSYSYDGSLTTQIATQGPVSGTIDFTHNNDFQLTSQSINGTNTLGFTYDDDGLLVGAGALSMSYDAQNGLIKTDTLGQVTSSYAHNGFGELTGKTTAYNGSDLYDRSFTRDSLGRITTITETIGGQTDTYEYTYNDIGYLVQVKKNGSVTDQYEYDANGNRTAHITPTDTVTATYDDQDRMLTYGEASYSYGKRGDLQRKIVGTDTTTYNYDNRGNLRSVTLPGGKQIEYLIDGQDRRVAKKVNGQVTTRWLYASGLLPIAVLDSTGSVEKRYGPGYVVKNDTTYRVVRDHLGSVRMVVNNQTGQVVQRIDYDAWGNITHLQNENEFTDIGFAGGLYDHDTGLVRFGARDYDPQTGR